MDELELRRSPDAETVGITDTDCTPRPRWRESQLAFEARMRQLGAEREALARVVGRDNRQAALRSAVQADGSIRYHAQCACSWHGLTHADPELARREYDAHPCTANDGDAIHRQYRGPIDRRPQSTMVEARREDVDATPVAPATVDDDFEQRVKLLETK